MLSLNGSTDLEVSLFSIRSFVSPAFENSTHIKNEKKKKKKHADVYWYTTRIQRKKRKKLCGVVLLRGNLASNPGHIRGEIEPTSFSFSRTKKKKADVVFFTMECGGGKTP